MFGVIVASRPVLTDIQTISPSQFAFNIPSQPTFSHIVVFLLPGNTLNPGSAAAVYVQIPPSTDFKLLGAVANDKQSAIFKVNTPDSAKNSGPDASLGDDVMIDDSTAQPVAGGPELTGPNIIVGLSIEPAEAIQAQLANLKNSAPQSQPQTLGQELVRAQSPQLQQQSNVTTKLLAQRIIKNAFNFLSSFAGGSSGQETVPLKSFQDWWTKFEKRIELDPGFLERDEQS